MKTEFQKSVTKEQLMQLCKLMHHTLTDEQLSKIEWHFKYTWVCVCFRVKDYGYISFGVDNHSSGAYLTGNQITKKDIQDALHHKRIQIKLWRFADDEIYKREEQAHELVKQLFKLPTVEEFHKIYYED